MPHDYLTVADVLGMHTVLIQRYGGALGLRDPEALEAALFHPQTGYYNDILAEAAALLESLAINHPFVDGNKRIAFAAADVFLRINGWHLRRAPTHAARCDTASCSGVARSNGEHCLAAFGKPNPHGTCRRQVKGTHRTAYNETSRPPFTLGDLPPHPHRSLTE
ncbi:type II toxin-antitoxin system death-on-curing family toxin [Acidithiobacillus ferridurans]|uniref:type II toxin-antitoxin system death-on-curing family toxin n=1 Tax=Acidithiobacillus ferridurans TaxID=1232575 RepID=UPI001C067509|nr:type II toxin-antitoxin system death-on-curing family toxin [Acidithiobacillus ferridurans]